MLKTIDATAAVYPAPVLIVGTYDKNGKPNAMNVAWGGQCGPKHVALNLSAHATTDSIIANKVFTVAIADKANLVPADYVGIVSANKESEKIAKAGWTVERGEQVDAPVIQELPVTMECKVVSINEELGETRVVGEIVATHVDEKFLTDEGKISYAGMEALSFISGDLGYYAVGERAGNAFRDGAALK
ncbi:MAG: flavin reductase family protein [Eggerthellaceae bacterium]|nr:flavin reductase family protein [Eggerthellaceae bacterium]